MATQLDKRLANLTQKDALRWCGWSQSWSSRGRPWPRGNILKPLALASMASPWPWPRSLKSSKIALFSAREQQYF